MFKGSDKGLHIKLRGNLVGTEISKADFNLITELRRFFFGFRDSGFITLGDFDLDGFSVGGNFFAATGRGSPKRAEDLNEPRKIDIDAKKGTQ